MKTMFVRVLASAVSCGLMELGCVERCPWRVWRRCPLACVSDLGRCVLTRSLVSPDHVVNRPPLIVSTHVDGTGLHAAWCRYLTMSPCLLSSYTLFLECSVVGTVEVSASCQSSVIGSHWPSRMNWSPLFICTSCRVNHASNPWLQN